MLFHDPPQRWDFGDEYTVMGEIRIQKEESKLMSTESRTAITGSRDPPMEICY